MKSLTTQKQIAQAKTIEEQLDLILKIEDDRKILKKQNKSLNEKYLKLTETFKKYTSILKTDQATSTELIEKARCNQGATQTEISVMDRGCQVDLIQQQENFNTLNHTSKLTEAMSFLKAIDTTSIHQNTSRINESEQQFGKSSNVLQNQSLRKIHNQTSKDLKDGFTKQKSGQISSEIVKMSKQMASLKRQLKDSQTKLKQREKQLKETKKCLETKSQALEKARKEFNELSMLLNTDKYKSVRNLEAENEKLKAKGSKIDEQAAVIQNLKEMLENITGEYSEYREEKQRKIKSLINQLKEKNQIVEDLEVQLGQTKNELNLYKG